MKRLLVLVVLVLLGFTLLGAAPGEIGWCDWLAWALTPEGLTVLGVAVFAVASSYAMKLPAVASWYDGLDSDLKQAVYFGGIFVVGAVLILLSALSCATDMSWEGAWWPLIQRVFVTFGAGTIFYAGRRIATDEVRKRLIP